MGLRTSPGPAAPEGPKVAKTAGGVTAPPPGANSPERLLDDSRRYVREGNLDAAKTTLTRYLGEPASSKQDEARALLADLDHAISKDEARVRAKALVDEDLTKYIDHGVGELLAGIKDPSLKEVCAGNLLEAFREQSNARGLAARKSATPPNMKVAGVTKKAPGQPRPFQPRPQGSTTPPARELEFGYKSLYNGQNFDGWAGFHRIHIPVRKGIRGGFRYDDCNPSEVAHRAGNTIVSSPVVGILSTAKPYLINSLKFDYMIARLPANAPPNARSTAHAVVEFRPDKPLNVGNMNFCNFIEISLLPAQAGEMSTRREEGPEVASQPATGRAAHPMGQWNEVEIKLAERAIHVLVNGVEVNRVQAPPRMNAKIAFSFGGVELHLANLRLH